MKFFEIDKFATIVSIIFYFNFSHVKAFKSHFEYHQQIYLNASSWVIQLQYNFTKMEVSASNFLDICDHSPETLRNMKTTIKAITEIDFTPRYEATVSHHTAQEARSFCIKKGNDCNLSEINSAEEQERIRAFLSKMGIERAYLNYYTANGELYSETRVMTRTDYVYSKFFDVHVCPPYMIKIRLGEDVHCFAILNVKMNKHDAIEFCDQKFGASVFKPVNATILATVKRGLNKVDNQNEYWLGGLYQSTTIPDVKPCAGTSGNSMSIFYKWDQNCVEYIRDNHRKLGVICSKHGSSRALKFGQADMNYLFATDLKRVSAAVSFKPLSREYLIEDSSLLLPAVCTCKADRTHDNLKESFKQALIAKIDAAIVTIERSCNITLLPIQHSPYIVFPEHGLRQKRFAAPAFIMSAFRATGSVLSGFARHTVRAAGSVGRQIGQKAAAAGRAAAPVFARAKTFLPSLKKTAYLTTSASAIGVTALAVDQYLRSTQFNDVHGDNFTDEIKYALEHLGDSAATSLHTSKRVLRSAFPEKVGFAMSGITNSLVAVVRLTGLSIAMDKLLIDFKDRLDIVNNHFRAYTTVIDALTSKVFTDEQVTKTIIAASKSLPNDYAFMSENIFDLISTATIDHEVENSIILVNLFVPVVKQSLIMYLFKGDPLPYEVKGNISVIPKYEAAYIAVSQDASMYALVRPQDLLTCEYKNMYLCNSIPLFSREVKTCMYSHFTYNHITASDCHFYRLGKENHFQFTSKHILYFYVTTPSHAEIRYEQDGSFRPHRTMTINGTGELKVEPGCRIEVAQQFITINPRMPNNTITRSLFSSEISQAHKFLQLPVDSSHLDDVYVPTELHTAIAFVENMPNTYQRFYDLMALIAIFSAILFAIYICITCNCTTLCIDILRKCNCPGLTGSEERNESIVLEQPSNANVTLHSNQASSRGPNTTLSPQENNSSFHNLDTSLSLLSSIADPTHSSSRNDLLNKSLPSYDQVAHTCGRPDSPFLDFLQDSYMLDRNITHPIPQSQRFISRLYPSLGRRESAHRAQTRVGTLPRYTSIRTKPDSAADTQTGTVLDTSLGDNLALRTDSHNATAPLNCSGPHNCPHCIAESQSENRPQAAPRTTVQERENSPKKENLPDMVSVFANIKTAKDRDLDNQKTD